MRLGWAKGLQNDHFGEGFRKVKIRGRRLSTGRSGIFVDPFLKVFLGFFGAF